MDKHTLGSWHIGVNSPDAVFSADGDFICNLGAHADANLIAAAPDLLAALEDARKFIVNGIELGYIHMPDPETPDRAHQTLPNIESAIAKARGE